MLSLTGAAHRAMAIWCVMAIVLICGYGCVDASNRVPIIFPIDGAVFEAGISSLIEVSVRDADGDAVSVEYRLSPRPSSFVREGTGRPTIVNVTQGAIFSWTPSVDDVLPGENDVYTLTFTADDGRGGRGVRSIPVSVRAPVQRSAAPIRFLAPSSEGVYVSGACLEDLKITVEGGLRSGRLRLAARSVGNQACADESACGEFDMRPDGPGREKMLNWCPGESLLNKTLHHLLEIEAREPGSDVAGAVNLFVRFAHLAGEGCGGQPPIIQHQPMVELSGPVDYRVQARFGTDVRFRDPPVVVYRFDDSPLSMDTWAASTFAAESDGYWYALIPHRALGPDETVALRYKIVATSDSDPTGRRCDLTSVSPTYEALVRPGDGEGRRYAQCEYCRSDSQCEGSDNLCLLIEGKGYCMYACDDSGGCGAGAQCVQIQSIDGQSDDQCVPTDLDCGQVCIPDEFEGESGNDIPQLATPIGAGDYPSLTVCAGERDYYRVAVDTGQSLTVKATYEADSDEVALQIQAPNAPLAVDEDMETAGIVGAPANVQCVGQKGDALVAVWSVSGQRSDYGLSIEIGEGRCDVNCQPDELDVSGMPGELEASIPVGLPWSREALTLCPGDLDRYEMTLTEQQEITVAASLTGGDGLLQIKVFRRDNLVKEALGDAARQPLTFIALADEPYLIELAGLEPDGWREYSLSLAGRQVSACTDDLECPSGERCRVDGRCERALCTTDESCGADQVCVLGDRITERDQAGERQCAAACRTDLDCAMLEGLSCKAVNLGRQRGCLPSGSEPTGGRCLRHSDCMGGLSCLDTQGGYCAQVGCESPCMDGTRCADWSGYQACFAECEDTGSCRAVEGYTCQGTANGAGQVCQPQAD
ncbi:MAG: Ig-like domain-containing protein [Myxococcota bacterium]|nr:Ig-like domain-containing protein [Myxococcota bacterium]